MTSIRDVAAAAHVSVSTVSAVLGGEKYVSPRLEARVRNAMEQLDYEPKRRGRQRPAENPLADRRRHASRPATGLRRRG